MLITINNVGMSVRFVFNDKTTECHITDRSGVDKSVHSKDLPSVYFGSVTRHVNDPDNRISARKAAFRKAIKGLDKAERTSVWAQYLSTLRFQSSKKRTVYHKKGRPDPLVAVTPEGEFGIEFEKIDAINGSHLFCYVQKKNEAGEWEPLLEGKCVCVPTDHFNGIFGRKLALKRAIDVLSKESRQLIWKNFLGATRNNLRKAPSEGSIFA